MADTKLSELTSDAAPTSDDLIYLVDGVDLSYHKATISSINSVLDHGLMAGLGDDDHIAYYNSSRHTKAVHDLLGLDHGSLDATSLTHDDHTIYVKADGTRAFTGVVSGVTPTLSAHLATKGYVDGLIGGSGTTLDPVLDRLAAPPGGPVLGDRYLATATAGGWTVDRVYEYNGATWDETIPIYGNTVLVIDEVAIYGYTASGWVSLAVTSHGSLTDLLVDDHTQYVLLAGRAGGQTIIGGTAAGEDITIYSTSNASKGSIQLGYSAARRVLFDESAGTIDINGTILTVHTKIIADAYLQAGWDSPGILIVSGGPTGPGPGLQYTTIFEGQESQAVNLHYYLPKVAPTLNQVLTASSTLGGNWYLTWESVGTSIEHHNLLGLLDNDHSQYLLKAGGTMTGKLTTQASATGSAGFNLPHGAAPTAGYSNGDIWTTTAGFYARINGGNISFDQNLMTTSSPTHSTMTLSGNYLYMTNSTNYILFGSSRFQFAIGSTVIFSCRTSYGAEQTGLGIVYTSGGVVKTDVVSLSADSGGFKTLRVPS